MSVFSSLESRQRFLDVFCSQSLDITQIIAFDPEEGENPAGERSRMMPHDLYDRLVECRNDEGGQFMTKEQWEICEKNLGRLARQCCLEHTPIQPSKFKKLDQEEKQKGDAGSSGIFQRMVSRPKKVKKPAGRKMEIFEPRQHNLTSSAKMVFPQAKQAKIFVFIAKFCVNPLSLQDILALAPLLDELAPLELEESSPHVLYHQLIQVRKTYAQNFTPHHLARFEENLRLLASVCHFEEDDKGKLGLS